MGAGRFITLEGGDGAGKSTQIKRLADFLKGSGVETCITREVGGCVGAEQIRDLWLSKPQGFWDPLGEVFLIMAARREHLTHKILPALKEGVWVISDRFVDSTRVYQGVGLGLGIERIDAIYRHIGDDFWPDLTLYLDLPVQTGLDRLKERAGQDDRYQQQQAEFHEKIRQGFLRLAANDTKRFTVIDAARDECSVAQAIQEAVRPLLPR